MLDGSAAAPAASMECKKGKKSNKKRFSDDQIRSLQLIFESDTKLEPMKKAEVAKQLGLQPRQVAIWFQNKRARWKSKQIEKDYTMLLAKHNDLASQFESLKQENHSLLTQLKNAKKNHDRIELETDAEFDHAKIDFNVIPTLSDDDMSSTKAAEVVVQMDEENDGLLKMVEPAAAVDSSDHDLINQPSESYPWWDFWC